jgi:hypothetical protein
LDRNVIKNDNFIYFWAYVHINFLLFVNFAFFMFRFSFSIFYFPLLTSQVLFFIFHLKFFLFHFLFIFYFPFLPFQSFHFTSSMWTFSNEIFLMKYFRLDTRKYIKIEHGILIAGCELKQKWVIKHDLILKVIDIVFGIVGS